MRGGGGVVGGLGGGRVSGGGKPSWSDDGFQRFLGQHKSRRNIHMFAVEVH